MKEGVFIAIAILIGILSYLARPNKATEPAELLTPQEYCEYIESLELYIQFLEDEIDRLDDAYIGDVIIETDEYMDYQEATNKFYHIELPLNKED